MELYDIVEELVRRHNKGELNDLTKQDLENIAMLAKQLGLEFKPKSQPLRKGLFDLADTALLGLIPNTLRPTSPGEDLFGESAADKLAGGVGTVSGALVPIGGAFKLGQMAKSGNMSLMGLAKNQMARLNPTRDRVISSTSDFASNAAEAASTGLRNLQNSRRYNDLISGSTSLMSDAAEASAALGPAYIERLRRLLRLS